MSFCNNLLVFIICCLILLLYFSYTKSSFVSERAYTLSDIAKKVFNGSVSDYDGHDGHDGHNGHDGHDGHDDDYNTEGGSFSKFKQYARKGGNDIDAAEYIDIYGLWQKNNLTPQSVSRVVDF